MTQIAEPPTFRPAAVPEQPPTEALTASPLTMVQALNRALHDAMAADDRVLVFGEDVATLGGVFRVTEGLNAAFGPQRCFDTPLAESAVIGIAVGLALRGFVPVPEIQFDGFSYPAFDQVVSHLAKYRTRTRGQVNMPVTVRIPSFGGIGAVEHHSESTESYWAHTAGLKVVVPSTPSDAYWLLRHSIACPDPVMFLEPKRRYWGREVVDTTRPGPRNRAGDGASCRDRRHRADLRRTGRHRTVGRGNSCAATWLEPRGHRSAITGPTGLRHGGRVDPPDRAVRGAARGAAKPWLRSGAGGPHSRGDVLRTRGTGVARLRIRHPVSTRPTGETVAARAGPAAGLRRAHAGATVNPGPADDRVKVFVVPDLGEGLEEVTLTCWRVDVGDDVELNQPLCSVETAKAEVEIPSPYAGRIVEIRGVEGDVLAVGSLLARIDSTPATNGELSTRKPVLVGYGADDGLDTSRRRPKAKPSVRKLAADLLVDLNDVPPGDDGLISRDAVLAAAGVGAERPGVSYDVLPVRGVHAHMAERMTLSRSNIPDAHASVNVDCTALIRLRDRLSALVGGDEEVISPFVLTLRLLVIALTHNKILNSTWVDGPDGAQVHSHHAVHLGFAVATPRGLLVPVVANAQAQDHA